jgi:hypothetical protein
MNPRTIAIGDIHGCSAALDALLEAIHTRPDDRIVTPEECRLPTGRVRAETIEEKDLHGFLNTLVRSSLGRVLVLQPLLAAVSFSGPSAMI